METCLPGPGSNKTTWGTISGTLIVDGDILERHGVLRALPTVSIRAGHAMSCVAVVHIVLVTVRFIPVAIN